MSIHATNQEGVSVVFKDRAQRFSEVPTVYTKRLVLSPITEYDLDDASNGVVDGIYDLRSHQAVMKWARVGVADKKREQSFEWLVARRDGSLQCPAYLVQLAGEQSPRTTIGSIGCAAESEVGYMLNPMYQNKGYATEAVRGLVTAYWEFMPAKSEADSVAEGQREPTDWIDAIFDVRNAPSRNVLQKCGFVYCREHFAEEGTTHPDAAAYVGELWRLARPGTVLPPVEDTQTTVQEP